jgi:phage repressor protein C with HTH and peptisase S24 domain
MPSIDRNRLKAELEERGITARALSLAIDASETLVRDILSGRSRNPRVDTVSKIAEKLGLQLADLMPSAAGLRVGSQLDAPRPAEARSFDPLVEMITVPEYDVRLSAGGGQLVEAENQTGVWQFSRRYLVDELRLAPTNLAIVEVQGDSMEPTLRTGDRVLIDHSDRNPARPGVYAIWDSNATVVKRLEKVPASDPPMLVLISDNKNHNAYTVPAELVNVIGRVVWFARRL